MWSVFVCVDFSILTALIYAGGVLKKNPTERILHRNSYISIPPRYVEVNGIPTSGPAYSKQLFPGAVMVKGNWKGSVRAVWMVGSLLKVVDEFDQPLQSTFRVVLGLFVNRDKNGKKANERFIICTVYGQDDGGNMVLVPPENVVEISMPPKREDLPEDILFYHSEIAKFESKGLVSPCPIPFHCVIRSVADVAHRMFDLHR